MLSKLSAAVFALLHSPQAFGEHPDVVEEYFYLAARFLDYCPAPLLSSELLGHVLRSAATGLTVEHREALRGVLHFCGEAAGAAVLAVKRAGGPLPAAIAATEPPLDARAAPRSEDEVNAARDAAARLHRLFVEEDCGARLVDGLLRALAGDLPASFLEEGRGSLLGCLWKLRLFCPPLQFTQWCQASLQAATPRGNRSAPRPFVSPSAAGSALGISTWHPAAGPRPALDDGTASRRSRRVRSVRIRIRNSPKLRRDVQERARSTHKEKCISTFGYRAGGDRGVRVAGDHRGSPQSRRRRPAEPRAVRGGVRRLRAVFPVEETRGPAPLGVVGRRTPFSI